MQCVIRTYANGYTHTTTNLEKKLKEGYVVVMSNTYTKSNGVTECIEYILEKKDADKVNND